MKKMIFGFGLFLSTQLMASIKVPPRPSLDIWRAVDLIAKIDTLPLIKTDGRSEFLELDKIECVFDYYKACSFFSDINGQRKLIVSLEGSHDLIRSLKYAGVPEDTEGPRIEARNLKCFKNDVTLCEIIEY